MQDVRDSPNELAFGEEMIVGYDLEHAEGDTIIDLARKNGCAGMLEGLDELLKRAKAAEEWKEIFDKKKNAPCWWNVNTDETTWEMPAALLPPISLKKRISALQKQLQKSRCRNGEKIIKYY